MTKEQGWEWDQAAGVESDGDVADIAIAIQLDEARWGAIVAKLPPLVRARALNGGRTRAFMEAVLWVAVTRQPWGRLPATCGPWHSVYVRFTRWAQEGIWEEVIASLHSHADVAEPLRRLVAAYLRSRHPAAAARRAGMHCRPF